MVDLSACCCPPCPALQRLDKQPVTVNFHVEEDFLDYETGVYSNSGCRTSSNHVMAAVGYNFDASTSYLIIRNSWGTGWGDSGYVKVKATGDGAGTVSSFQTTPPSASPDWLGADRDPLFPSQCGIYKNNYYPCIDGCL